MSAHTPGPSQMTNGVKVCTACQTGKAIGVTSEVIVLCPLHAAAPLMYEELARVYTEEGSALKPETCTRLLALLAQVQGGRDGA